MNYDIERHELIDCGGYPEITAHGVADVRAYGAITEVVFFRWKKDGDIIRRVVSGLVFRPTDSLIPSWPLFEAAIHQARLAQH